MKHALYIIMCMCLMLLASCTQEKKKGKVIGKVQSAPYELLVVADKEWLKTDAGQSLVNMTETPIEGIPQPEPNFRATYIYPHAFSGTFRGYANIIVVNVGKKYKEARLGWASNVYAQPQVVLSLEAPDDKSFAELVMAHRESILEAFNANEFKRERAFLKKKHSGVVSRQVQKQFGVDIQAPVDVDDIKKGKDFMWASASEQEFRLNVCVYTLPLREMTAEKLVEARDSVMKINIPGGREGQWMETDRRSVLSGSVTVDGKDLMAVRGFWDMKDDAMGGPFVGYVYSDEKRQRLLIAEGFVFAPNTKKRPLIRQLEATLQTINLQP